MTDLGPAIKLARQRARDRWLEILEQQGPPADPVDEQRELPPVIETRRAERLGALWVARKELGWPADPRLVRAAALGARDIVHLVDKDIYVHAVSHYTWITVMIDGHDIDTGQNVTSSFRWDSYVNVTQAPYLSQDHQMSAGLA